LKQALVLGATSDIAKFISLGLAKRGYNLHLTGRNIDLLTTYSKDIETKYPVKITNFFLDITNFESHKDFYESLSPKPELIVCCIGYYEDQTLASKNLSELLITININYTGILNIINIISNEFQKLQSGKIVVLSSVAGVRGRQLNYIYGSTKAGLTTYLSGLRNRLFSYKVSITTVLLGPVYTKMSEGHNLLPILTLKPEMAAEKIINAGLKGKGEVYIYWPWQFIMLFIKMIPEFIFKRLPPF